MYFLLHFVEFCCECHQTLPTSC